MEKVAVTLLLVTLTVAQVQGIQEDLRNATAYIEESGCLEKENVDITDIFKLFFSGKEVDETPIDMKLKCFSACIMEYSGAMDGCTVLYDQVSEMSDEDEKEVAITMLDACTPKIQGDDRCECAYQMVKCMAEVGAAMEDEE